MRLLLPPCLVVLTLAVLGRAEPPLRTQDSGSRPRWTTSRVVGSPGTPPPYRVRNAYPRLKVPFPMGVAREPGTKNLLLLHQAVAWGGRGRILRIKDDPAVETGEELLHPDGIAYGVAFHPRYAENGYLYVGDNGPMSGAPKRTRVTRYTVARTPPHKIDPASAKVILAWESDGHNGGDLAFGPDGLLYVTSGDGTSDSDTNLTGQDLTKPLAKVLRIDVDRPSADQAYAVPPDNPFLATPGARPETWAYGFRNPWRIHVDLPTGDVWVGNNGQDLWEQVYLVRRGANYGWSIKEGGHDFYINRKAGPTPLSPPLIDHPHSEMRSLTGGVVYRGTALPDLRGAYLYGDWSTGRIWGVRHEGGKVVWHRELADTTLQITGFGLDTRGELLIVDHGGGLYTLDPSPPAAAATPFPTRLSDTGLFRSVERHEVAPGLVPYSVNAPLWSDGAAKDRYLALPGDARAEFTASRGWNFPEGTVLVKTFAVTTPEGAERRIETRLLTKQIGKWAGYSYLWNDAGTDADLVPAVGADRTYRVRDGGVPEGERQLAWHFPSRVECMVCHSRAANWVLGLTELQMNRVHDQGGVPVAQLRTLERLDVFKIPLLDHVREARRRSGEAWDLSRRALTLPLHGAVGATPPALRSALGEVEKSLAGRLAPATRLATTGWERAEKWARDDGRTVSQLPKPPHAHRRLPDPSDPTADLDRRARAYLHANCSQCHVEAGGGNALMQLEYLTPLDKMNVVGVKPNHDTFGVAGAKLIAPGEPEKSVLYLRMTRRGPGQMPPLATTVVDREAAKLLHDWIRAMPRKKE